MNVKAIKSALMKILKKTMNYSGTKLFITEEAMINSSARMVHKGDILYALYGATSGEVSISKIDGAINQAILAVIPDKKYDTKFLEKYLNKEKEYILNSFLQGGQGNLSGEIIRSLNIIHPSFEEQQKIGSFFEQIDKMIQLQQSKVNKVKDLKSAYLSEMFPKEGEKYPKRRFGGFIKPWIQYELGDLAPLRGGNSFQSNKFVDKGVPIVRISNILTNETVGGSFVFYEEQTDDERFLLPHKSAVLAMSGATTGKVSILNNPNNQKVYQNQRIGYFRDIGVVNYSLISTLVKSLLFDRQLKDVLVAGAQPNVSPKEIDSFVFLIPNDKEEQKKIAEFFENLDNQIAIEEEKLVKLEKLKQAYLNDMFV